MKSAAQGRLSSSSGAGSVGRSGDTDGLLPEGLVSPPASDSPAATAPGRTPTERQFEILMQLGSGAVLLTGRKREVDPLLRHGWVTADHGYAWVRITAAGLHALARAVEKYGLPEMTRGKRYAKVCAECGREWRPKCRCGGQSYRFEHEEVERAAA